ncbi:hypothetical protein BDP27DRAFT_1422991 [Rhodocollybia butyracea]|uniref:Uncharacterized protein n=1 Tax=Rhodocollybia butyracea TaxID=206335 RepID=A0A9P5PPZ7_9AGAR|nr:hypothetical protein BDP27DRAFT_1422991 [Rhodocollybia butyracea]
MLSIVEVKHPVILGLHWLKKHNLIIDWASSSLTMSCCDHSTFTVFARGSGLSKITPTPTGTQKLDADTSAQNTMPHVIGFGLSSEAKHSWISAKFPKTRIFATRKPPDTHSVPTCPEEPPAKKPPDVKS